VKPLVLLSLLAALAGPQAAFAQASIDVDTPVGGWRAGNLDGGDNGAAAAYPRPPVDRGAQAGRTLITGRLKNAGTERNPARMIVNGSPMPLYTDEAGQFARPWAFGPGSNSIEIRSNDGHTRRRIQFVETDTTRARARLRVVLTWDDPHAEIDLHVISPVGEHAFWADPALASGGGLDVDSVDGAGPEIFSTIAPISGTWLFYVNYWGNFNSSGYNFDATSNDMDLITCTLSIVRDENTPNEKRETLMVPMRKIGDLTLARVLQW